MLNITELKEKCSVIEQCLPVSDFREQVAKTHGEIFEYISALEAENKRLSTEKMTERLNNLLQELRRKTASECVELLQKMGEQRMLFTSDTSDHVRVKYSVAVIRQHFGITDRFAGAGKVMEESDSVRN